MISGGWKIVIYHVCIYNTYLLCYIYMYVQYEIESVRIQLPLRVDRLILQSVIKPVTARIDERGPHNTQKKAIWSQDASTTSMSSLEF